MVAKPIKLPAPDCRWTARRKAAVLAAIGDGLITVGEACRRYGISIGELAHWNRGGLSHKTEFHIRHGRG